MSDIIIRVENLSKRYRLGQRETYESIREALVQAAGAPIRRLQESTIKNDYRPAADRYIWAFRDVSFEVGEGEVLGIIGRNGAGKSTVAGDDGQELSFNLRKSTELTDVNGKTLRALGSVKKERRVEVKYTVKDGQNEAISIHYLD